MGTLTAEPSRKSSKPPRPIVFSAPKKKRRYHGLPGQTQCPHCLQFVPGYYLRFHVDRDNVPWAWHVIDRCFYDRMTMGIDGEPVPVTWGWAPLCIDCYYAELPISLMLGITGCIPMGRAISRQQAFLAGLSFNDKRKRLAPLPRTAEPHANVKDDDGDPLWRRTWYDLAIVLDDDGRRTSQGGFIVFGEAVNGQLMEIIVPLDDDNPPLIQSQREPTVRCGVTRRMVTGERFA